MSQKVSKQQTTEQQLLQAREQGKQEALLVNAMNAHGKVLGMDCFSWMNPHIDALSSVMESLPFQIIWIGQHDQIKDCINAYPSLTDSLETIIVTDRTLLNLDRSHLSAIKNIVCVEGATNAFELLKTMKKEKSVFLFTSGGKTVQKEKELFDQFISLFN